MELYQLRSFVTVANTGNLTQASEQLFTSQPAVSAHIKALEEEFEMQLFKRSPKGMTLTANGILLKEKALKVLESSNELKVQAATLKGELAGTIKIGLNADAYYLRLSDWHQYLLEHFPRLNVELIQGTSIKLVDDVATGRLDASFIAVDLEHEELENIRLLNGYALVAASPKWQSKMHNAKVDDLALLPWIQPESYCVYHQFINDLFTNKKPNNITTSASEEFTISLLLSGTGLSLIRDDQADELLMNNEIVVWDEVTFPLPLNFTYLKKRATDPIIQCLLDVIPRFFDPQNIGQSRESS